MGARAGEIQTLSLPFCPPELRARPLPAPPLDMVAIWRALPSVDVFSWNTSARADTRALVDAYQKLRPWTAIEACECDSVNGLFLLDLLTDNPLHCSSCRREVDPSRLALSAPEVEAVARWFSVAKSLYLLWLDSGEYEAYAKARLSDPHGRVNRLGIEVAELLSTRIETRLWLFHDTDDGEPTRCPVCGEDLDTKVRWGTGKCPRCPVFI
jgi:hypothetical protein